MKKHYLIIILFCFGLCTNSIASLSSKINSIVKKKEHKNVKFAISIVKASSNTGIYTLNASLPLTPASNMKIVVSAASLHYLGSDYRYDTKIGLHNNTLVILGSGDPLLADKINDSKKGRAPGWLIDELVKTASTHSIETIQDIVIDSTCFDDQLVHPSWPSEQLNRDYACEVSGVNYNGNCIEVTCTKSGGVCYVSISPYTGYIQLIDKTKAISKGSTKVGSYRNSIPNKITVFGKCNKHASFDVAIERPAIFFGYLVAENFRKNNISVRGDLLEKRYLDRSDLTILLEHQTPIKDVLTRCNKDSYGLAADALVKTISFENKSEKRNGSWQHGLQLIGNYLNSLGIPDSEFIFDDGRGLSRKNDISARALSAILHHVYHKEYWPVFKESLAVGGIDGTIYKYFRNTKYKDKVIGKTGYINGVRSFSGYCQTKNGDYIFAILTEGGNSKVRKSINDIVKAIMDYYGT